MYVIYMHLSMLTGQTDLPPNQPTSLKVKNLHNFDIFQPICLKLGIETRNRNIQHMYLIYIYFCRIFDLLVMSILWNLWSLAPLPLRTQSLIRFFNLFRPLFWQQICNLKVISFHLIGHTICF